MKAPKVQKVVFDDKVAKEVFWRLILSFRAREGIYAKNAIDYAPQNSICPRELLEPGNELKHAIWRLFAASTDRRTQSMSQYKAHAWLWTNHPHIYTKEVLKLTPKELQAILRSPPKKADLGKKQVDAKCKLTQELFESDTLEDEGVDDEVVTGTLANLSGDTLSQNWLYLAKTLFEDLDGDPRNLFKQGVFRRSIDEVIKWREKVRKERGYNPLPGISGKILSLIAVFLSEQGIIDVPEGTFPADLHAIALCEAWGITRYQPETTGTHVAVKIRPKIYSVCKALGVSPVELSHAVWILGQSLCPKCYSKPENAILCPMYEGCKGRLHHDRKRDKWCILVDGTPLRRRKAVSGPQAQFLVGSLVAQPILFKPKNHAE